MRKQNVRGANASKDSALSRANPENLSVQKPKFAKMAGASETGATQSHVRLREQVVFVKMASASSLVSTSLVANMKLVSREFVKILRVTPKDARPVSIVFKANAQKTHVLQSNVVWMSSAAKVAASSLVQLLHVIQEKVARSSRRGINFSPNVLKTSVLRSAVHLA